jgi:insulin-like growth factor 2 mRNA-binding protein 1
VNDITPFQQERIITISGSMDNICLAEADISARLKSAYENDVQHAMVR